MGQIPLYVLSGQSNAVFLNRSGQFAAALADRGVGEEFIISAEVGRPLAASATLTDYYPFEDGDDTTGELYVQLVERIQAKLASNSDYYLAGIFWLQGEEDSKTSVNAAQYYTNLHQLHLNLMDEFGDGFDFVINELPTYIGASYLTGWDEVQAAQERLSEVHERAYLASSDPLIDELGYTASEVYSDNFHYTDLTYRYLADRFLEYFPTNPVMSYQIGPVRSGIAARDDAVGQGYIMYSATAVSERMPDVGGTIGADEVADHLVAVVFNPIEQKWYYDSDTALVEFTPDDTDVLLAAVDFSQDTITALAGQYIRINGIVAGYAAGNLAFHADWFDGLPDAGEFDLDGNWFEFNDPAQAPEVVLRQVAVSRAFDPEGNGGTAAGSEAGHHQDGADAIHHDTGWLIG